MGKELLLEIGVEEIPSSYIPGALGELAEGAKKLFQEQRILFSNLRTLATPRRLTLYVEEMEESQQPLTRTVVGPPKGTAFDAEGLPTKAALGFARAQGLPVEKLQVRRLERGEHLVAVIEERGQKTFELLPELLPRLFLSLSFPKAMRWGEGNLRFVRPIRWLLALFGGRMVPFEIDGIKGSNKTYGHRFMSPGPLWVRSFEEYLEKLEEEFVIVDPGKRREMVTRLATEAAEKVGGRPVLEKDLVETVTNLVEYPSAVCGSFAKEYLILPREVIMTPMRRHQRYFPVVDAAGKLLPFFVAITNIRSKEMAVIREGNERVLRARLSDANFFYQDDRRVLLADRVPQLKQIIFHERLGTLHDKIERLQELVAFLAEKVDPSLVEPARRAAYLSKTDLLTTMVKEFPELQGIMGREYALLSGGPPEVAQAIEEHYLPRFTGDRMPASVLGLLLAIADRADSLAGCFGIGLIPTGSEDPYALRRASLGTLQILLEKDLPIRLSDIVGKALNLVWPRITRPVDEVEKELLEFFRTRLHGILVERGIPGDLADAVLSVDFDDVFDAGKRAEALRVFRKEPDFNELSIAFKRVANIIPKDLTAEVSPRLFTEGAERALHGEAVRLKNAVNGLLTRKDYLGALRRIATLKPIVDMFFEEVLVNVEEEEVRTNRHALLKEVADLFGKIADFRKIVITL